MDTPTPTSPSTTADLNASSHIEKNTAALNQLTALVKGLSDSVLEIQTRLADLEFDAQTMRRASNLSGLRPYGRDTTMPASAPFKDAHKREQYNIHHS
jgi:hypothetical protein